MKEAMGGTWIFGIVALFIVLFSTLVAYSISYTKAFKVKNEIINYIEQSNGFTKASQIDHIDLDRLASNEALESSKAVDARIYVLIRDMGYNSAAVSCVGYGEEQYGGYCLSRVCYKSNQEDDNPEKVVYKITTFVKFNIPVVNLQLKVPIMGETKAMYHENEYADDAIKCWDSSDTE